MATTPEGRVKNSVKRLLKQYNVWYAMPATGGYGSSGVPDFLCCVNGHFLGIEAKAGPGVPTALQINQLRGIVGALGSAIVVNETNLDSLEDMLRHMTEQGPGFEPLLKPVLPPTMKALA